MIQCFLYAEKGMLHGAVARALQHRQPEVPADHGCHDQRLNGIGSERGEAATDDGAEAFPDRAAAAAARLPGQQRDHLTDEQWVSVGCLIDGRNHVRRRRPPRLFFDKGGDLGGVEASQRGDVGIGHHLREHVGEFGTTASFGVPKRPEEDERKRPDLLGDVAKEELP